ncbi:MAG: hypothetical protein PVF68_08770 [Acidobacteriota bacterium]
MREILRRALTLAALVLAVAVPAAGKEEPPEAEAVPRAVVPPDAEEALERAREAYALGDWEEALAAYGEAERAGARTGSMFYRMGYCHGTTGNAAEARRYQRDAVRYFEDRIARKTGGIDPYYFAAAACINTLEEPERGIAFARKGVEAAEAGTLGEMDGEEWFRLGRLYGFLLEAPDVMDRDGRVERQMRAYRRASDLLAAEGSRNHTYRFLAAFEVGRWAREQGDRETAIEYFSRASSQDLSSVPTATALNELAMEACRAGELEQAAKAWLGIRGPGSMKTPAQYGLKLARKGSQLGDLPTEYQGQAIAEMDRAGLEQGMMATGEILRTEAVARQAQENSGQDPEAVEAARRAFVALALSYLIEGHDIRMFVLGNQMAPLIFR